MTRSQAVQHFQIRFLIGLVAIMALWGLWQLCPTAQLHKHDTRMADLVSVGREELNYSDGTWWVGDERVWTVACPNEDSCKIQWVSGDAVWIFRTEK